MSDWRHLAERLVEIDFAIEDLDGWATAPDDVAELERLEALRDDIFAAVARRRIPLSLRDRLTDRLVVQRHGLIARRAGQR